MHTSRTLLGTSVTPSLTTYSLRQHQTLMPILVFFFKHYSSSHRAASAPMGSLPATCLLTMHASQITSNKLVPPDVSKSFRRQCQTHMLIHLFLSKFLHFSHIAVSAPINSPAALHLLTVNNSKTTSNKSVNPHLSTSSRRQKQAYLLTHPVFSRSYVSCHIGISGPTKSTPATHMRRTNTSKATSNKLVTSHLSTTSRRQQQAYMLTRFHLSRLYISGRIAISRPQSSLSVTHLLTMNKSQTTSNKSFTSLLDIFSAANSRLAHSHSSLHTLRLPSQLPQEHP